MPKKAYKSFQQMAGTTRETIERADTIITDYMNQGLVMTLRQLYYQFVSRDWLPNTLQSYNKLKTAVNTGRLVGMLDWEGIEDRTRNLQKNTHWRNPAHIIRAVYRSYMIDRWQGMDRQVEVWIEKEALAGVLEGPCEELDVPFFACRGYTSQSEMWRAGNRMKEYRRAGREPLILHLGDHDPSGIDMTRDIKERLRLFAERRVEVQRIALNMNQVDEYSPPPNPAKMTDSRFQEYSDEFGDESWELDALDPSVLVALITEHVLAHRDQAIWDANVAREEEERDLLRMVSDNWDGVKDYLEEHADEFDNDEDDYDDEDED
jgi:hypothetical protein